MFQKESKALQNASGVDRVFFYEVHNDRTSSFQMVANLFFPILHCWRIRKMVEKYRVNVVHIHNDFPILTLWIFRFLRKFDCVRIQTLHNYRHWCISGPLFRTKAGVCELCIDKKSRFSAVIYRCYRKSYLQSLIVVFAYQIQDFFNLMIDADAFFCLSEHQKSKLLGFGVNPRKLFLKPNFVSLLKYAQKEIIKKTDLIYVGRIEESKGILKVIDALDSNLRSKLMVVGHTEDLFVLKRKYPEVRFLGKKSHLEALELIQKSRFLLHSSLCYETFGLTMIEAMSLGTPVIGFPIGTRNDFIQHGVNGFFMTEKTINQDIEAALNFPDYSSLRMNAIESVKDLSESSIIQQQVLIYKELIHKKKELA